MSTVISREEFLQDVRIEVEALKANATPREVAKLNIETFNADSKSLCIYGQMTGNCSSYRAKELMDASCVRVTNSSYEIENRPFDEVAEKINGDYAGQTWREDWGQTYYRRFSYLSMVEMYIFLKGASPKNIMDYLKGEVETLELPLD
jgi:hypothetical protein